MTDINYLSQRRHREEKRNLKHVGLYCKHLVRAGCPSEVGGGVCNNSVENRWCAIKVQMLHSQAAC